MLFLPFDTAEQVASTPDSLDLARIAWVIFEFAAKFGDRDVDRAIYAIELDSSQLDRKSVV